MVSLHFFHPNSSPLKLKLLVKIAASPFRKNDASVGDIPYFIAQTSGYVLQTERVWVDLVCTVRFYIRTLHDSAGNDLVFKCSHQVVHRRIKRLATLLIIQNVKPVPSPNNVSGMQNKL